MVHPTSLPLASTTTTPTTSTRSASPPRPSTPQNSSHASSPFDDNTHPISRTHTCTPPLYSRPASSYGASSAVRSVQQRYFHSRRVPKGEVEQPWKSKKDPREKWVTIIPLIGLAVGLVIAAYLVYDGIISVVQHNYRLILSDDFSDGLNANVWTKEAEVGGFG